MKKSKKISKKNTHSEIECEMVNCGVCKDDAAYWEVKFKEAYPSHNKLVDGPAHYGGADNPYEAIKVIEAWKLGFNLGNVIKYVSRAGKKDDEVQDLNKALYYLKRHISNLSK